MDKENKMSAALKDAPQAEIDFSKLSQREIEDIVDKGLRHTKGKTPYDYLKHFLYIARHFAFATHDDSWGELEKEFTIIVRRMVIAERELARYKALYDPKAEED